MSGIAFIVLIMILLGTFISILSLYFYNKRLDKITKGEIRDVHSKIPEPSATAGISYKIVLMGISIIAVISLASLTGQISALNNTLNNLEHNQFSMQTELNQLLYQIEESNTLVSNADWMSTNLDLNKQTLDIVFDVSLKQFSDDTDVSLDTNGKLVPLKMTTPGSYHATFTADLFEDLKNARLLIKQNGVTQAETLNCFPDFLFWSYLPIPQYDCNLTSDIKQNKLKCSGWFKVMTNNTEDIEKATITYVSNGKDLKSIDGTKEIIDASQINIEEGLDLQKDLAVRVEIITKEGFMIQSQMVICYETAPTLADDDFTKIFDPKGNLIWTDPYKN